MTTNLLPKFFKVYAHGESGVDLVLPVSFNRFLPKSLPRSVTVKSIYGNVWDLALRKSCGDDDDDEKYVLVDGWKRIVKDEDLKFGDFLVFEFDGSKCFNFCIFEHRTRCKRLRKRPVEIEIETSSEEEEEEVKDSEDDDYTYANDGDSAANVVDLDDEVVDLDDDDDEDEVEADDNDARQYLDDRENPSFKKTINPKKKSQLRIPSHVIKDYGLNFPESISIVDPLVRKFGTLAKKVKIQKNGCVFIKGFGGVIRRNDVKTTDTMIFEVKKSRGNVVHTIKVHIIRG